MLTDVDGVLTDGGMYYSDKGDVMKKFHVRDGMGITLLRKVNIPTIIVTKERTQIVRRWADKMKIKKTYDGILQKEKIINKISSTFKITKNEMAYIGDDINDLNLLKKVGFSSAPRDGITEVKKIVDYVCKTKSGRGAFREVADLIFYANFSGNKLY